MSHEKTEKKEGQPLYDVEVLCKSQTFYGQTDLLKALMNTEETLSVDQAQKRIQNFLRRSVN